MIIYKGGECERCGLRLENTHYSVFDFHHIDSSKKDVNWKRLKYIGKSSWTRIQNEIDNCKLLCSNCHRLTHAGV